MSTRSLLLAAAAASGAALVLTFGSTHAAPAPEPAAPRRVRAVEVTREVIHQPVRAAGVVAGRREVPLAFKVGGVVRHVAVREGERVRAGMLLAALDPAEIAAQVDGARTLRDRSLRELERAEALHDGGALTRSQKEDARTAFEAADAAYRAAAFNERHARIVAPGPGRVLRRLVEPGQVVSPGTPVLELAEDREGWVVRAGLADRDAVRVRVGDGAEVLVDAWPDRPLAARVLQVPGALQRGTGVAEVELALELPPGEPPPISGLAAKVLIEPSDAPEREVVPLDALVEADGDRAALFVLDPAGGTVHRREVRVARLLHDGRVALLEGPGAGARVVTDGAAWLRDGEHVIVEAALAGVN